MAAVTVHTAAADIPKISIIATHSIQKKTSQGLRTLYPDSPNPSATTLPVIALVARSQVSSKAITIAEIIKRRVAEKGDNWYQYSALSSVIVELTQKDPSKNERTKRQRRKTNSYNGSGQQDKKEGPHNIKEGNEEEEEEEEDPFSPMKEKVRLVKKKVPLLTIYISRSPLPEFAGLYGEQAGGP